MSGIEAAAAAPPRLRVRRILWPSWLRVVLGNGKARVGLSILAVLVLVSAFGPFLAGTPGAFTGVRAHPPSLHYPFGTTNETFDVFSQVLYGGRLTLLTIAASTALAMLFAVSAGLISGTFGGRVDALLSTAIGTFLVIPMLPMAILIAGTLPRSQASTAGTIAMIALACWAPEARVLRAQALSLRERDFVQSAILTGESRLRVAFGELLPNMASRIAAGVFFVAIQAMVVEATLDYLSALSRGNFALGDVGGNTWASILATAQNDLALLTGTWWHFLFPALALLALATGLVLTMHGLEELADPRLRVERRRLRLGVPRLRLPRPRLPRFDFGPHIPLRERLHESGALLAAILRTVARRLPIYVFALWIASTVCFALPQLNARTLNPRRPQPISPNGYGRFLERILGGHLDQGIPGIADQLWNSLPYSLLLVGVGTLIAFVLGISLGMVAGWRRGGFADTIGTMLGAALWATPGFVLAGLGLYFLTLELHWFPDQWSYDVTLTPAWTWRFAESVFRHAQLPILVLVVSSFGFWALSMRNVMTSVASEDYIQLARVKGLSENRIMVRYAGRNALLPVVTGFAVAFGLAIGGIPAIEAIFSYAGGGFQMQLAAMQGNFPLVQGIFLCIALFVAAVNLAADVLQVVLDPRLR
jgi:peptide/nickel transport system permease protein